MDDKKKGKEEPPMKDGKRAGAVVGVVLGASLTTANPGCSPDPADVVDRRGGEAHAAEGDDLSALEAPASAEAPSEAPEPETDLNPEPNMESEANDESDVDPGVSTATDSNVCEDAGASSDVLPTGEIIFFLPQPHAEGDLDIRSEAADPDEREPIPFRLEDGGNRACCDLPRGITHRLLIESSHASELLHCEVQTDFDRVGFPLDFEAGSVALIPIEEGEGL